MHDAKKLIINLDEAFFLKHFIQIKNIMGMRSIGRSRGASNELKEHISDGDKEELPWPH